MSDAYDKMLKRADLRRKKNDSTSKKKNRILQDSFSQGQQIPNIFGAESRQQTQHQVIYHLNNKQKKKDKDKEKRAVNSLQKERQISRQNQQSRNTNSQQQNQKSFGIKSNMVSQYQPQQRLQQKIQIVDDQDINQGEQQDNRYTYDQQKAPLNLLESIRYFLGLHTTYITYPRKQTIYIDCNNPQNPEIKSPLNNDLTVNMILVAIYIFFRQVMTRSYILLWIIIIIVSFVIESGYRSFGLNIYPSIFLGLLITVIIINGIIEHLMVRNRRVWNVEASLSSSNLKKEYYQDQNRFDERGNNRRNQNEFQDGNRNNPNFGNQTQKYKVYHHYGENAEWIMTQSQNIHAGQIFKVPPGKYFPCDCLLLHSKQTMIPVQIDRVFPTLTYHPKTTMKQALIKADIMLLPISGQFQTQQISTQIMSFSGALYLTSPVETKYQDITISNMVLRGYKNVSEQCEILCLAVSTGVQNFSLRQSQYPMVHSINNKHPTLSDLADRLILITLVIYLISIGLTILFHYIYVQILKDSPFYFKSSTLKTQTWKIFIHLLINYAIFIPIFLRTSVLLFIYLQGIIIQKACKINQRVYTQIKDFNSLQKLQEIDTVITSIDCLRNPQAFTMHSFRVKEIHHIFDYSLQRNRSSNKRINSNKKQQLPGLSIFQKDNDLTNSPYGVQDIDLIKYFMSVALLTTHTQQYQQDVTGYQKGIQLAAKQCGVRMDFNRLEKCTLVNNEQFRVKRVLKIPMTYHRPYCLYFYKPVSKKNKREIRMVNIQGQEQDQYNFQIQKQQDDRILCLIRGDPILILNKVYGKQVQMSKWSTKTKQQKGYKIQLIGKMTLKTHDLQEIQKAYKSGNMHLSALNQGLQRYLTKVQAMGLLIFNNQFLSNRLDENLFNIPLLNNELNYNSLHYNSHGKKYHKYSLEKQRKMIILTPPSDSIQAPQFQSIHTLTNLLQQAFKLNLNQVSSKLIHDQIITAQTLLKKLNQQKILVLNGWSKRDVIDMISDLVQGNKLNEKKGNRGGNLSLEDQQDSQEKFIRLMSYFEKDQYLFICRKCQVNVSKHGFDLQKYSDIVIKDNGKYSYNYENMEGQQDMPRNGQSNNSSLSNRQNLLNLTPLVLKRLLSYDTPILSNNLKQIILNQFTKTIMLITIQLICSFYTLGSGILLITGSQYILLQALIFFDIFYYLNFGHQKLPSPKQYSFGVNILTQTLISLLEAAFIVLITIYSLQSITNSSGTVRGKQFTSVTVFYSLINFLILRKFFTTPVISFYKLLIIALQLLFYYIGMILISQLDKYSLTSTSASNHLTNKIFWHMFQGRMFLTGVFTVAVCLSFEMVKIIIRSVFMKGYSNYYKKLSDQQRRVKNLRRINGGILGDNSNIDEKGKNNKESYEIKLQMID